MHHLGSIIFLALMLERGARGNALRLAPRFPEASMLSPLLEAEWWYRGKMK
jgi:hypothetical protein